MRLLRDILRDIAQGKNIENYFVIIIGIVLIVVEFFGNVDTGLQLTALLMGTTLLVFKSRESKAAIDLDGVLQDRQSFRPFREFVRGGRVLDVYGPSAVGVLGNSPDIEREILARGGKLRVLLQDPEATESLAILHQQLDQMSHLLESDIARSLSILREMAKRGLNVEYRLLKYSPGFSLVVVDPDGREGRAVVEFFGFTNQHIIDRMHLEITRQQSQYWLEYWASQFETMWDAAAEPQEA